MIFETHAHYNDSAFAEDRDELLMSMAAGGVGTVLEVCAAKEDIPGVRALAEKYSFVYCSAGIHPEYAASTTDEDLESVKKLGLYEKCVAVGEIGLDYHYGKEDIARQKNIFIRQLELAGELDLPVIIHSRDAAEDTREILKASPIRETGGVMHCYSYSKEMAAVFLDMGMYFGIGGVLTFKNSKKLRAAVEYLPMEALLLETDCPYMAPEPNRGKRNCSLYIPYVIDKIAEIKGISAEEVTEITRQNALRLFRKAKA